jgi:hypothetical protein
MTSCACVLPGQWFCDDAVARIGRDAGSGDRLLRCAGAATGECHLCLCKFQGAVSAVAHGTKCLPAMHSPSRGIVSPLVTRLFLRCAWFPLHGAADHPGMGQRRRV